MPVAFRTGKATYEAWFDPLISTDFADDADGVFICEICEICGYPKKVRHFKKCSEYIPYGAAAECTRLRFELVFASLALAARLILDTRMKSRNATPCIGLPLPATH